MKRNVFFLLIFSLLLNVGCAQNTDTKYVDSLLTEDVNMFFEENAQKLDESKVTFYFYDRLQGPEKELYCIIYNNMVKKNRIIQLPEYTEYDIINRIFTYVVADHPELYWIKGYELTLEKNIMTLTTIQNMTVDEVEFVTKECEDYKKELDKLISDKVNEYEISKAAYEYIIKNCKYGKNENDQNILSVIIDKMSVCSGLSKAYQFLLQEYGIEAATITGLTDQNVAHMWNIIKIDGKYYYTDITYGNTNTKEDEINYDYFNVTTDDIVRLYRFNAGQVLEDCVSVDANYYKMNGSYYQYIDVEQLQKQFDKGLPVTIKCANQKVYIDMVDYLIANKGVFEYMDEKNIDFETDDITFKIFFRKKLTNDK